MQKAILVLLKAMQTVYDGAMSKISKSFRFSEQAISNLSKLAELTGSNETAIVELSLAYLVKLLTDKASEKPEAFSRVVAVNQEVENKDQNQKPDQARKRHKPKR